MINEILLYLLVFCFSMAIWLPIYKYVVSRWVQEATISRIESGDIDLNYLLDEGGVFDNLAERTVTLFKHHMLDTADPMAMGLQASEDLLKMVGMKKVPPMLQYKLAQALGQMVNQTPGATTPDLSNFDPSAEFYKQ
jgi:hypothetical protein